MTEVPAAPAPEPAPGYASAPIAPAVPGVPVGPRSPLLMGVLAVVMVIAGVANIILFTMSPGGPIEGILAFGTGASLLLAGIALGVVALVLLRGSNGPTIGKPGIDGLAITSVSLGGVALVVWAVLGGGYFVIRAATGSGFRFMEDVNGAFFAGIPWMLALVFGAISYRPGRGVSSVLALIGIGIGVLLIIPTLASGVIYGLHLSP